ncbi:hemolysin family protein [Polymorphum gilvum]|uniref:Probable HlyC/CorC family of transporters with 2 CBS domains n=1 Tax=Polymorphum gilvum (strain LMG 25793 / CGMCC 1.9160 / SL003B-26A1) TaxID=991905 RepID=F2IX94_POLGS|nr:hemolysin family protein [Polymorphum gilvum]ADZ70412.1 Probable HlyC/CorC family of transporters with 2 CBS domains [Polymorphum gilvum SL003B-26A1]
MLLEIAIVIGLTLINGLLAMSELAVVSARPARLKAAADRGSRGTEVAVRLAGEPGRFLSTVQIGITLVGVLSGAFSGATLGIRLSHVLQAQGLGQTLADGLGVGLVVVVITYLSLIVGELVPKQIALRNAEAMAARVAPAMLFISRVAAPLVWFLDVSGKLVLGLLGQRGEAGERVTEEEVRTIIAEAKSAGVLETAEHDMISGVMRFADRTARALMTPRREVEILDLSESMDAMRAQIRQCRRARLPARDGEADDIIGAVLVRDLIEAFAREEAPDLRAFVRPAPVVIDTAKALDVLKRLRESTLHMAIVFDEYGHFEGIVTSGDILESITGEFQDEDDTDEPAFVRRAEGSYLVAGWMPIDEAGDMLGLPVDKDPAYETMAGLVLSELNRLPETGEVFDYRGWRIEVIDLDGRRIDKLLVSRLPPSPS